MVNGWCFIAHTFSFTNTIDRTFIYLFYSSKVGNDIEIKGRMLDEIFAIQSKPEDIAMGIRFQQLIYAKNWGRKVPRNEIKEYAESHQIDNWHATLYL